MNVFGHLVMLCWMPVVLTIFALSRNRGVAVVLSYLIAWLFLPFAGYSIPGLPDYDKFSATSLSVVLAIILYDAGRLISFRFRWFDLPMVVWCVVPFVTAMLNELGSHEAMASSFEHLVLWGLPYFTGRLYMTDRSTMLFLAIAIFFGALVYLPLILFESRMSAQIHKMVYGLPTRASFEQIGFFGPLRWKPSVFMDSALALTMFMVSAALIGLSLWQIGRIKKIWRIELSWGVPLVVIGAILGKGLGAITLMFGGIAALYTTKWFRAPVLLIFLMAVSPTYLVVRTSGIWSGDDLVGFVEQYVSENRSGSLAFRLENEDLVLPRALERPWLGWGRFGRGHVYDARGNQISVFDGLWLIALARHGLVGVTSLYIALLLPPALLMLRQSARFWTDPFNAAPVALAIILLLYSIDCLMNAMINPTFIMAAGGLIALPSQRRAARPVVQRRAAPARPPLHRVSPHPPPEVRS